jgi:hypothetical protein
MRALVFFLTLLAVAKVGYHEWMYRQATNDVIVSAYRDRAIAACQKDAKGQALATANSWTRPASVSLVIGKSNLNVYFWQVDHAMWSARFKNPYLFVKAGDRSGSVYCEFDIVHGAATVFRM